MIEYKITKGSHLCELSDKEISFIGENVEADIFLKVTGNGEKNIKFHATNSRLKLFVWVESEDLTLNETYVVYKNSDVTISFADVYTNHINRKTFAMCEGYLANLTFTNVTLSDGVKNIQIDVANKTPDTSINMENFTVATENSSMNMIACGRIVKGAKRAKNFQENHCLTMGKVKKLNVQPKLIIDENDVEAGHGSSIGDINEETMYYLNSRGLTKKEALSLIVHSFLCTVAENIDSEELKQYVLSKIENKVEKYAQ